MKKQIEAILTKSDRLTYIEIPFDPSKEFNIKGKIELQVTINEVSYIKSLLSRGNGNFIITFNKEMIKKMGINIGEKIQVLLENQEVVDKELEDDQMIMDLYKRVQEKKEKSEELSVLEAIFTRRSIRKFKNDKVEDYKLDILLKAGSYSPSTENKKPVEFILIKQPMILKEVSKVLPRGKMIQESNCAIVVCGNSDIQKQKGFLIEDCSASIQNILLAAHGLNLSAVWCGIYPISKLVKNIRSSFEIPENIIPVGIVAIGYSDEEKIIANRFDKEKVHLEKW